MTSTKIRPPSGYALMAAMTALQQAALAHGTEAEAEIDAVTAAISSNDAEQVMAQLIRATRSAELDAEASRKAAQDAQERARRKEAASEHLRAVLLDALMSIPGHDKNWRLPELDAIICEGPRVAKVTDIHALPGDLVEWTPKVRKDELTRRLKTGEAFGGAMLSNGATYLRLHPK